MTQRSGATLVEVLVTIFVMALGLIALLTLFPIGALRMAEAIKDSRTAQAAANANAIATARNFRNDSSLTNRFATQQNVAALPDGPSYPVFMDPIGVRYYSPAPNNLRDWVAGRIGNPPNRGIERVMPSYVLATIPNPPGPNRPPTAQEIVQRILPTFSLLDDITFGPDGVPVDANGNRTAQGVGTVQREGRYSWALLFKRPKTATPSVVDLSVVVYSGRPLQLLGTLGLPFGENEYEAEGGNVGGNTLIVKWNQSQEKPNIKKGSWILDTTSYNPQASQMRNLVLKHGPVHGFFYRVTNIALESGNQMVLQLETPLKAPIGLTPAPLGGYFPRIVVMENVVEVFEKGTGWLP